eukprot:XP_001706899.1 Hypothetical protein GL50803_31374 [Giardia lamblia ATCC 50803]
MLILVEASLNVVESDTTGDIRDLQEAWKPLSISGALLRGALFVTLSSPSRL